MPESDTNRSVAKPITTRFPFINLSKAVERAKLIFDADQRGREIAISGAFEVWGYSGKSSGGFQTIGALKMYGLLKDSGGGDGRKIALTDEALRYFKDEREDERARLLRGFALKPKLIYALFNDWHGNPPADTVARSHLKTEIGLNDQSARSLLSIYKENLEFADLKGFSKAVEKPAEKKHDSDIERTAPAKIGDFIQWVSGGVEQFKPARRVSWVSDDKQHLRVHGSPTGILMTEVVVVDPPMPSVVVAPAAATASAGVGNPGVIEGDISAYLTGGRLQITADVDLNGIQRLKQMLDKYEEILRLFE